MEPVFLQKPHDLTLEECQEAFAMFRAKKVETRRNDINRIINIGIPHIGEQIFKSLSENDLIHCLKVSNTWEVFSEKILLRKWKGKLLEACQAGKTEIVRILLDNGDDTELNATDEKGKTAFIWACENGHEAVASLLLIILVLKSTVLTKLVKLVSCGQVSRILTKL